MLLAEVPQLRLLVTSRASLRLRELLATTQHIGLNVRADNTAAIACYRRPGLSRVAGYEEVALRLQRADAISTECEAPGNSKRRSLCACNVRTRSQPSVRHPETASGRKIDAQLQIAAEVGFSETAFACPLAGGWRVRYFAPETEVPFCGHATIALGAALALHEGDGQFTLQLNDAVITVEGQRDGGTLRAAVRSSVSIILGVSLNSSPG